MGQLAEPTLNGIRNRGATERKKARRVEAFVAEDNRTAANISREEGQRGEEGDTRQRQEEGDASLEDWDALMEVVAEAISQTEREAAAEQEDATTDVRGMREAEATRNIEAERGAES